MKILLCGVGNSSRGDDGFGPYIVQNLKESNHIKTIDCGTCPENYLNKIVDYHADLIIFIDAISKNGKKYLLLKDDEIVEDMSISVSTHNLPFRSIYDYITENSHASIWLLGVKPISYNELHQEIKKCAHRIIDTLNLLDSEKKLTIIKIYENLSAALR